LDESPIESAAQLRFQIRNALKEGQTDQQIVDGFIAQYGQQIVTKPPLSWSTYALWFGPWLLFVLVLGIYIKFVRTAKKDHL